jgi:hypothetical protein
LSEKWRRRCVRWSTYHLQNRRVVPFRGEAYPTEGKELHPEEASYPGEGNQDLREGMVVEEELIIRVRGWGNDRGSCELTSTEVWRSAWVG